MKIEINDKNTSKIKKSMEKIFKTKKIIKK